MKNIVLMCAGGMSTSIIMKNINIIFATMFSMS